MLPWTRNQSLTLEEQLELGVRWFDIRISFSKDTNHLYASHTALTTHSLESILTTFASFLEKTSSPLLFINLRVDYKDRSQAPLIQPYVSDLLLSYIPFLANRYDCGLTIEETSVTKKMLIYCSDRTIQDSLIIPMDLMPCVSFWDANSIEDCEKRLFLLQDEFHKQEGEGIYLFPKNRMIVFDYSSNNILWYTDKQMIKIMNKYKNNIVTVKPTILAGNHVQDWMELFE